MELISVGFRLDGITVSTEEYSLGHFPLSDSETIYTYDA